MGSAGRAAAILLGVGSILLGACTSAPTTPTASTPGPTTPAPTTPVVAESPPPCLDAKLVWADALDRLLLVNCVDQFDLESLETVWAWDGSAWEELSANGPPANVVTAMAWDPDRDVLVRYGGIPLPDRDCSPDTWEWDMTEWRRVDGEPPDACDHAEMAWDASAEEMLLIGGGRGQRLAEGTWGWDGATWSPAADAGPPPRAHHGFASGELGTFVSGGFTGTSVFQDLWAWTAGAWTEVDVAGVGPGPRSHHGWAVGLDRALLFGGATRAATFDSLVDETWLFDGTAWTSTSSGPAPSSRGLPALGYDAVRDVFVLHGGFTADGSALGDTWEFDGEWTCVAGC